VFSELKAMDKFMILIFYCLNDNRILFSIPSKIQHNCLLSVQLASTNEQQKVLATTNLEDVIEVYV